MTIPKFRELLAHFQAQAEAHLDQAGPMATADTGFMKRRDHLAELQRVRDDAAAVVQKYRDEAQAARAVAQERLEEIRRLNKELSDTWEDLAEANRKLRSLRGTLGSLRRAFRPLAGQREAWRERIEKIDPAFWAQFDATWRKVWKLDPK